MIEHLLKASLKSFCFFNCPLEENYLKMCGIFAIPATSWQQVDDIIRKGGAHAALSSEKLGMMKRPSFVRPLFSINHWK